MQYHETREVASKYFGNNFISEKYKTIQSFKLNFLQIDPLYKYTLLPTSVGIMPGSHLVKAIPVASQNRLGNR
jgi:hypothetical protein